MNRFESKYMNRGRVACKPPKKKYKKSKLPVEHSKTRLKFWIAYFICALFILIYFLGGAR